MKKLTSLILTIAMVLSLMTSAAVVSAEGTTETLSVINFSGTTTYYSKVGAEGKLVGKFSVTDNIVDEDTGIMTPNTIDYKLDEYTGGELVYTSENPDVIASVNRDGSFTTAGYGYTVITATAYDKDNIAKAEGSVVITVFDSFNDGIDNDTNMKDVAYAKDPETNKENFEPGNPDKIGNRDKSVSLLIDDGEYYWSTSNYATNSYTKKVDPEDENHTVMTPTSGQANYFFYGYPYPTHAWNAKYLAWQTKERVTNVWFYDSMETVNNSVFLSFCHNLANTSQGIKFGYNKDNRYLVTSSQNYGTAIGDSEMSKVSDVQRSKGWHQLVLVTEKAKHLDPSKNIYAKFYIDGHLIYAADIYTEKNNDMMIKGIALQNGNTYFDEIYSVEYKKPVEISVMPENNAQNVPVETKFEINFGREVENTDGITVTCNGTAVEPTITQNAGRVTVDCGILEKNADYTVTVGNTVTFKDRSQMPENLVFNYKTADGTSVTDSMGRKYSVVGSKYISFDDSTKSVEDYGMNYVMSTDGFESKIENGAATFTKKTTLSDGSANNKANFILLNYLSSIDPQATTDMPKAGAIDRYVIKYKTKINEYANDSNLVRPIWSLMAAGNNKNNSAFFRSERMDYFKLLETTIVGEGDNRRLRLTSNGADLINLKDLSNWNEVCYIVDINNWETGNNATVNLSVNGNDGGTIAADTAAYRGNNQTVGIDRLGRIAMCFVEGQMQQDTTISVKDFEIYALQKKCDYSNLTVTDTEGTELTSANIAGQTVNVSLDVVNNNALVPNQELTATVVIYNNESEAKLVTAAKAVTTAELGKVTNVKVENIAIPEQGEGDGYQMRIFIWDNYNNLVPLTDKISFK